MPNKYADLGFEPIKEDIPAPKKKADYSDLGFEPIDQKEEDYADLGFEPETKTPIPRETEDKEFQKMSRLGKVIDVISRPSAAIKSSILEIQKQQPKMGIKTDGQGKVSFGEIEPAEKPFSVSGRIKALGRGFTGKERISANELYKNVGVEGVPLLGFATEVAIDPLTYTAGPIIKGALKGISGAAKATKTVEMLSKIIPQPVKTAGTQIAGKIAETTAPLRKQFKRAFSTSTGVKPLDDLINKYSGQREYMKSQAFQYGVKVRNVIQNLSKKTGRSIDDLSQEVVNLIEQPEIAKATIPETKLLAKTLGNKFSDILTKEMKAGVPITALSENVKGIQYFPRITTSEAKQYLKQAKIGNSRVWNPKIANALKRKTGDFTLEEFNIFAAEHGLESLGGKQVEQFFMKNPAYATAVRGIGSAKAVSSADFIQEAGKIFGKTVKEIPYGQELPESLTKIYPSLKGKVFDPEVLGEITHTHEKVFNPQQVGEFLKIFDNVQNYWKGWTLSPFPKYHFRNIAGNLWNNYLAGVVNPKVYKEAGVLQQYRKTGSEKFLKLAGFEKGQADSIIQEAEKLGVLGHGWYGSDIPQAIEKAIQKPSLNLLSTEGALIRGGRAVGTTFENNARLAHFIDKIQKGAKPEEAALSVKKFLFDYGDLTPFEKQVMKRLAPFYTFTRKNIPLQIEQFIKQPQKYLPIVKLLQNRDTKNLARLKYTQPQLYERLPFELRKDIDTVTYVPLEGLIPAADLSKIIRPHELLFELMSPYIKAPIELGINKSFYNEREIEKYDEETQEFLRMDVPVKWKHAITTIIPQARMLNEINKVIKKKRKSLPLTAGEQAFSQTLSSVYKMDISDMQLKAFQKIKFKIDDLKNAYRWAIRNKRPSEAKRILKTINEVVGQFKNVL